MQLNKPLQFLNNLWHELVLFNLPRPIAFSFTRNVHTSIIRKAQDVLKRQNNYCIGRTSYLLHKVIKNLVRFISCLTACKASFHKTHERLRIMRAAVHNRLLSWRKRVSTVSISKLNDAHAWKSRLRKQCPDRRGNRS